MARLTRDQRYSFLAALLAWSKGAVFGAGVEHGAETFQPAPTAPAT